MGGEFLTFLSENIQEFFTYTGFANFEMGNLIMILCGILFIYLAIAKEFEPMLLIPIGFGILIGNIPFKDAGLQVGIYEEGSVLNILYQGVVQGWYPPLIFLGIGAMTDFSALISNPKLMLIGAAAQFGIFGAYAIALMMGFEPNQAGAIGIIGGADGPTAIFLSSKLAPNLMGAIAISAYSYMALVPVIQPPIMRLLTTKKERLIRMKPPRVVSQTEKIIFPIAGLLLTCFLVPSGLPLLGMLFFGNLLKESGVTRRLAETARGPLIDVITILLGVTVGASTQASQFLTMDSVKIFALGRDIGYFLDPQLQINALLLPADHLHLVEIYHERTMATEHIRISEAFLDRLQGVAKHKLRELPLIQIPDTNVIIRRFKVQQVTSLHGKAQLVLLVIERENALPNRRFRLVLLQQSQLSLFLFIREIQVQHGIREQ